MCVKRFFLIVLGLLIISNLVISAEIDMTSCSA